MKKITIKDAISCHAFFEELKTKKIPLKLAYKLSKIQSLIKTDVEFYQTKLKEIIEKYGEKDEQGNFIFTDNSNVKIMPSKINECQIELNELYTLDFEIENIYLTLDELESIEVTLEQMEALSVFIKE